MNTLVEILILATGPIAGAIVGLFVFFGQKKSTANRVLHDLIFEYRSVSMLEAIQALYKFKSDYEKKDVDLHCEYLRIKKDHDKKISESPYEHKDFYIRHSLHCQRRLVSHFYYDLFKTIKMRIVKKKHIFRYWHQGTLKIIPEIIMPIGLDNDKQLMTLYDLSGKYKQ